MKKYDRQISIIDKILCLGTTFIPNNCKGYSPAPIVQVFLHFSNNFLNALLPFKSKGCPNLPIFHFITLSKRGGGLTHIRKTAYFVEAYLKGIQLTKKLYKMFKGGWGDRAVKGFFNTVKKCKIGILGMPKS